MAASQPNWQRSCDPDGIIQKAIEISPTCTLALDLAGRMQLVNPPAVRLLGAADEAALLGLPWLSIWGESTRQLAQEAQEGAASGESRRFRAQLNIGGEVLTLETTVAPIRDNANSTIALLVASHDITDLVHEHRLAEAREETLARQAEFLLGATDLASVVGFEIDFRSNRVLIGDANVRETRRHIPGLGEFTLQEATSMYAPEERPRLEEQIARAQRFGEPISLEGRLIGEGNPRWTRMIGYPVMEDGVCIGLRGAGMDITEEVNAREAIRSAQERLQIAIHLARMEVYELDFDRQVLIQEGAAGSLFERPLRYEDLSRDPLSLVDRRDRERVKGAWIDAAQAQIPFRAEFRLHRTDGIDVWVYGAAQLTGDEPVPQRVVGAIVNITERKEAELKILETMRLMREHEEQQKLLLDELNHRVKNTLAAVQSIAVQSLTDARPQKEARQLFIDRLLALSATHNLLVKRAWHEASFRELTDTVLSAFGQAYLSDGPDLHLDPNFAVSLGMALHELATNALKHGAWRAGGHVRLTTAAQNGGVCITWREHGGPPVEPPKQRGFGSRLLERGVAGEIGGAVKLEFLGEGLVCTISASLSPRLKLFHPDQILA